MALRIEEGIAAREGAKPRRKISEFAEALLRVFASSREKSLPEGIGSRKVAKAQRAQWRRRGVLGLENGGGSLKLGGFT
jgi:hypothetical protein